MPNRHGQAGRRGLDAHVALAFLDEYTSRDDNRHRVRINGRTLTHSQRRQIRRWRNGHTQHINPASWLRLIVELGFTAPWFQKWCKKNSLH